MIIIQQFTFINDNKPIKESRITGKPVSVLALKRTIVLSKNQLTTEKMGQILVMRICPKKHYFINPILSLSKSAY